MATKEKFGKFVLLQEVESSPLGSEYRAAKLGPTGLERIVSVLRLGPSLSANAAGRLMEQVKTAAQVHAPNVLKTYGIGKVEGSYYISHEFLEGQSLRGVLGRCRQEGFPLSVDHALLIASKVCSALEAAHARKTEDRRRSFHGMLNPGNILISYEGEVRVRGFGYWASRIREAVAPSEEESLYLAPEQLAGEGDPRSDTFALGAVLFETLTGQPLLQGGRSQDMGARIAQARLLSPAGDDDSLPPALAEILRRSLDPAPERRYPEIQEMRKAIDTILFAGDFSPTTFNLAFFMHSLFREDIEREAALLKAEREASYAVYFGEEAPAAKGPAPEVRTEARESQGAAREAPAPKAAPAPPVPPRDLPTSASSAPAPAARVRETPELTFHKETPRSKTPLAAGLAALVILGGAAAWFFALRGGPAAPTPAPVVTASGPSAEALAAMAKVKELEEKLRALEAERAAAEASAAEEAKKKIETQAAAKGQAADPAAIQRAQEEARRKAQAEQEKRVQEEKRRLEEEKRAEETRLAEEKRAAERRGAEEASRTAAAAPATTVPPPATEPPAPAAPALRPGTLVELSDPGVIGPVAERTPALLYPPIALRQRVEGTVELRLLVDERGLVLDAKLVSGAGGRVGLNEAAIENVKKRRYRPASKDGVPVKVWIPVRVRFEVPK